MSMISVKRPAAASARIARLSAGALAGWMLLWSASADAAPPESFADLAERVSPAVVNIASTHTPASQPGERGGELPFPIPPGSPLEEFFREFQERFGEPRQQREQPRQGVGSGFIVDPEGYVVTNNHVIDGADDIQVKLSDGREYPAEVVGIDPQTDLALLRIEPEGEMPYVSFGDSDAMRVGDWVIAVGNPFGLGGTVTAGIISARGRDIYAGPYDDFLQTDAAINRGNSGGPMFNLEGEVIGVSTAIFSPTGGSVGIGFAIPSNLAREVVTQLREAGAVERGWIGVRIQEVTPELAEGLGLDSAHGALVASVQPDGPAAETGLQSGDVILGFDSRRIERMRDLPRIVAGVRPGSTVDVEVWRNGEVQTLEITVGRQTPERMAAAEPTPESAPSEPGTAHSQRMGARLATLDDALRAELGLPDEASGVVLTELDPDGRAASQGLRRGDLIEQVDGQAVTRASEVEQRLVEAESAGKSAVVLLVRRDGEPLFLGFRLEAG